MKELGYLFAKLKSKLHHNDKEIISDYFRRAGMQIGENCNICCNIMTSEPYLVELGDHVTISGNVVLVTHDNSVAKIYGKGNDLYGKICIGNHCFIGQNSTILYGVTIPDCVIIGAGSVVTKSVNESGVILAGNPARVVGTCARFFDKVKGNVICTKGMSAADKKLEVLKSEKKHIRR